MLIEFTQSLSRSSVWDEGAPINASWKIVLSARKLSELYLYEVPLPGAEFTTLMRIFSKTMKGALYCNVNQLDYRYASKARDDSNVRATFLKRHSGYGLCFLYLATHIHFIPCYQPCRAGQCNLFHVIKYFWLGGDCLQYR